MTTDTIADYLTRLRNAIKANHRIVEVPSSKVLKRITEILADKGYIDGFKFEDDKFPPTIKIALKYHPVTKMCAMRELKRVSRPGRRHFVGAGELPRVLNGLGIAIISTSQGMMTDKEARKLHIGGEVICYIS